jgi:hypothetical protein
VAAKKKMCEKFCLSVLWVNNVMVFKRSYAPLFKIFQFSFQGELDTGGGVIKLTSPQSIVAPV